MNVPKKFDLFSIEFLSNINPGSTCSLSLLGGSVGIILAQCLLSEYYCEQRFKDLVEINLDIIIDEISNSENLAPGLSSGAAGLGWLFLFLNENKYIDINASYFLEDLDVMLTNSLSSLLAIRNYDPLYGAVGIGLYFLKRNNTIEVENIIKSLSRTAERDKNEIKWRSRITNQKTDTYNFGLAHGITGTLYFLGKCVSKGICSELCKQLIYGILETFWNNLHISSVGSLFPNYIPVDSYENSHGRFPSKQLAWCYGDLCILHTIYIVSIWLHDLPLSIKAQEMLIKISGRRLKEETNIIDPYFCHGSSGVAFLFQNLLRKTGKLEFGLAGTYWSEQTASVLGDDGRLCMDSVLSSREKLGVEEYSVLSGKSGIALSLTSYLKPNLKIDWSECLFLT